MSAIADSGFIVALENTHDRYHLSCLNILRREREIYLPQSVLNEVCFLLTKSGGNWVVAQFLQQLPVSKFILISLSQYDLDRAAELLIKYADTRVDFVDASVTAIAERLNITRILTVDRRDFDILRPAHIDHFEILP
ncbi:MAG: PIN domain-containing protein [Anaerolineae bacterium]|nr:PIN domain-containing protein [Anaerolineae bacterium]